MTDQNISNYELDLDTYLTRRNLVRGAALATTGGAFAAIAPDATVHDATTGKESDVPKRDWWDKEFRTLVALGESTTAGGAASTSQRCWVSRLSDLISAVQRVPIKLVNSGIGANVISTRSPCYQYSGKPAGNERLERHVIVHKPDLLVVSYGLNDARGGTPLDLFCEELRKLIDAVREEIQPLIVLIGPYYMTDFTVGAPHWGHADLNLFHEFNDVIAQTAETCQCLYVDLLSSYRGADWLIHRDGVHANDLGHMIVANKIFELLASSCSGLAQETKHLEVEFTPWRDESTLRHSYGY